MWTFLAAPDGERTRATGDSIRFSLSAGASPAEGSDARQGEQNRGPANFP